MAGNYITLQDIFNQAIYDSGIGSDNIQNWELARYFNRVRNNLLVEIDFLEWDMKLEEYIEIDLTAGQTNYTLPWWDPLSNNTVAQVKKIKEVSVKYEDEDPSNFLWAYNWATTYSPWQIVSYQDKRWSAINSTTGNLPTNDNFWTLVTEPWYQKARPESTANLYRDTIWYETNHNPYDPFFLFTDDKIQIYPTPLKDVTDGLRIWYIRMPLEVSDANVWDDLTTLDIGMPRWTYDTLVAGMVYEISKQRRWWVDRSVAKEAYDEAKMNLTRTLSDMYDNPVEWQDPIDDLQQYMI